MRNHVYGDVGNGPVLVLVHGFPHDRRLWRAQVDGLRSSARVITPDLPGFGERDEVAGTMTMDAYAADLKSLIDGLGIERVVIGGLSMGGYIALAFLARFQDAVSGLILCNTRASADSAEARIGRENMVKQVMEEGVEPVVDGMVPRMLAPATRSKNPELSASVRRMMGEQRAPGIIAALRGMAVRPDRTSMLPGIQVPTLIITGSADTLILPAESEAMARAIPSSSITVIPGVAHLSNVEAPQAFNTAVRTFLGTVR